VTAHRATVEWRSDGKFASGSYSRRHEWRFDGGAKVIASSSPDVVQAPMSDPAGVDPEEALIASTSSCHMLWFLSLAQAEGIEIAYYRDEAEGVMGRVAPGKIGLIRITLRPEIGFDGAQPEAAALGRLHHQAHERCFIANSLKTEIVVAPR
jgi:organic hydroperoxide reductase OsmC/OhrA